jgi:hypothetical protein
MKAILLGVLLVVVCIILFVAGVLSPRRSRRLQERVDELSLKGEDRGARHAGRLGDATQKTLGKMRGAADASAAKGRQIHDRLPRQ